MPVDAQENDLLIKNKADFIVDVASKITYPIDTSKKVYRIGILGRGPDVVDLSVELESRCPNLVIQNKVVEIYRFKKPKSITPVDLLHVSSESKIRISELNSRLGENPYIIVTENFPFGTSLLNYAKSDSGGIVFELQDEAYLDRGASIDKSLLTAPNRAISEEEWNLRLIGAVERIAEQEETIVEQGKELVEKEEVIQEQRTVLIVTISALLIILGLSFIIIRVSVLKNKANKELAQKSKSLISNINYAKYIQDALLPDLEKLNKIGSESFVWNAPKEILSGDFYWVEEVEDRIYFSVADCTGHGVPGAFLSVMCINALTRAVKELKIEKPAQILDETVEILKSHFGVGDKSIYEGMDLALCCYHTQTKKLEYAGANNPLYLISDDKLQIFKPDRQPVGKYIDRKPYSNHSVTVAPGDCIYLFTDGIIDQFGGDDDKKMGSPKLKKELISLHQYKMKEQKKQLESAFNSWKGKQSQLDDVCVMGIKF